MPLPLTPDILHDPGPVPTRYADHSASPLPVEGALQAKLVVDEMGRASLDIPQDIRNPDIRRDADKDMHVIRGGFSGMQNASQLIALCLDVPNHGVSNCFRDQGKPPLRSPDDMVVQPPVHLRHAVSPIDRSVCLVRVWVESIRYDHESRPRRGLPLPSSQCASA
jgi:hypothetical protein